MQTKTSTFNEEIIAFIRDLELSSFSVIELRDAYQKEIPGLTADQAYKAVYKAIWQMHSQGVFEKVAIEGKKSAIYRFSPSSEDILQTVFNAQKRRRRREHKVITTQITPSKITLTDDFIKQMIAELPLLESEMLAKKAEAQEYQRFLPKLPNHKDMLLKKFSEANAEGIKLLGRITAIQRVLSEFR
jgi:hypothetical protein